MFRISMLSSIFPRNLTMGPRVVFMYTSTVFGGGLVSSSHYDSKETTTVDDTDSEGVISPSTEVTKSISSKISFFKFDKSCQVAAIMKKVLQEITDEKGNKHNNAGSNYWQETLLLTAAVVATVVTLWLLYIPALSPGQGGRDE